MGIVIAHPDDESMFFAPALTTLQRSGERAFVLCLSTGKRAGLLQRVMHIEQCASTRAHDTTE